MNVSLIAARDQRERARSRVINVIGEPNAQQFAPKMSNVASSNKPLSDTDKEGHQMTSGPFSHSPVNRPSDYPKTGSDHSDEPQAWTPHTRNRGR